MKYIENKIDKCQCCGQPMFMTEIITNVRGEVDSNQYTWFDDFKLFKNKYVPDGEIWLVDVRNNKITKIVNIGV